MLYASRLGRPKLNFFHPNRICIHFLHHDPQPFHYYSSPLVATTTITSQTDALRQIAIMIGILNTNNVINFSCYN